MNSVPVYEMKNKLSQYLHMVVEEGPVGISVHGKPSFVIQTIEEFDEKSSPKESVADCIQKKMRAIFLDDSDDNDDFDFSVYLDSLRANTYYRPRDLDHLFD